MIGCTTSPLHCDREQPLGGGADHPDPSARAPGERNYEQLIDANHDGRLDWGEPGGEDVPAVFDGITYTGASNTWPDVVSHNVCVPGGGVGGGGAPAGTYNVDTFANAPVFASATSTTQTGS